MKTLILDATTKSIEVVMSGAASSTNPDFVSTYADSTTTSFTEGSNDGALNGTTPVTLVAAPAASTQRVVKSISIQNKDDAEVTITVSYNNNATLRQLAVVTLGVGDTWTLDGTYNTSGSLKNVDTTSAAQLSDLSDVGVTTPTDKNALMADGDSWESRALVEADISDLGSYITATSTNTLTNKAITKRVVTTASDTTAVIDATATDVYQLTAMAGDTTFSFTGTPVDGQTILIRFKDNGTTRGLTWTGFTAIGVTLPTTTTVSKWHYVGVQYNLAATQWHVIAVTEEA